MLNFFIIAILAMAIVSVLFLLFIGFPNKDNDTALLGTLLVSNIIVIVLSCFIVHSNKDPINIYTSSKKEEYVTLDELKIILLPITTKIKNLEKNICY